MFILTLSSPHLLNGEKNLLLFTLSALHILHPRRASHNPKNDTLVGESTAEEELMTDAHVMDHVLQTGVQNAVMKISQLLLMVEWNQSLGYLRGFFGFRDSLGFCA